MVQGQVWACSGETPDALSLIQSSPGLYQSLWDLYNCVAFCFASSPGVTPLAYREQGKD